ncbi:hypothetical protein Tco_0895863 [Tanacetum coccineum]|uniref:Uncharacterized protein n=1 Tax=Tanacetum coccineum TaxID=301880 RepID=A0ABQ5CFT5_9ASTR
MNTNQRTLGGGFKPERTLCVDIQTKRTLAVVHGQPNAPHGGDDDDGEVEMVTDEDGYGSGGTRRLNMVDRDGDDEEMEMLRRVILFSIHNDEWKSFQCHHQTALRSYALSWKSCQGGSSKLNLPDHRYKRRCCSLIPAKSNSLPHAHAQSFKKFIMAQQPQQQPDVLRDTLCPPHKEYDIMDANKKQFWHTLKQDESKDKLKFFLDTKEFQFSVDDLRRIFQQPQAIENNNVGFVTAPSFSRMLPFFQKDLGFSLLLRLPSHFVSKGIPQPWKTLVKIFARCLTT